MDIQNTFYDKLREAVVAELLKRNTDGVNRLQNQVEMRLAHSELYFVDEFNLLSEKYRN